MSGSAQTRRLSSVRKAFTLFEIAISLLLMATAILSVIMAFPVGIKAQRLARFRIYADAKILEMIEAFANTDHAAWNCQVETKELGQNTLMRWPVDFDRMVEQNASLGLIPLPRAIASRLDSD